MSPRQSVLENVSTDRRFKRCITRPLALLKLRDPRVGYLLSFQRFRVRSTMINITLWTCSSLLFQTQPFSGSAFLHRSPFMELVRRGSYSACSVLLHLASYSLVKVIITLKWGCQRNQTAEDDDYQSTINLGFRIQAPRQETFAASGLYSKNMYASIFVSNIAARDANANSSNYASRLFRVYNFAALFCLTTALQTITPQMASRSR